MLPTQATNIGCLKATQKEMSRKRFGVWIFNLIPAGKLGNQTIMNVSDGCEFSLHIHSFHIPVFIRI